MVEVRGSLKVEVVPVWKRVFYNVTLPIKLIFDHVPMSQQDIKYWLRETKAGKRLGELMFPRTIDYLDSKDVSVMINYVNESPGSVVKAIQADITISIFRRDLGNISGSNSGLHPFDHSHWSQECYKEWRRQYVDFAPSFQQDQAAMTAMDEGYRETFKENGCIFFRALMRAHYTDCVTVFGKLWRGFGLGDMAGESMSSFMPNMLLGMFFGYHLKSK